MDRLGRSAARRVVVGLAGMIAVATALLPAGPGRAENGGPAEGVKPALKAIADCLAAGREVVMPPQPECVDRQAGDAIAEKAGMPLGERDWVRACSNGGDARRLPRDTVKRLAREADIAPSGIRIVGALFCDGIDLAGVDLPYSLVLDRAVVMGTVDARNLRLKGDFSIEYAVLFGTLRLNRAQIEGSVYLGAGFIRRLRAYDTRVTGSWQQKTAIVFLDAHLVRLAVSGDVDLTRSAFSRLWIQSGRIGGTLRLDETEARCAYHVNASTIGYLTAHQAGFGKVVTIGAGADATRYPWWRHAIEGRPATYTQTLFRSAAIAAVAEAERRRIVRPERPPEDNALLRGCREETETLPDGSTRPAGIEGIGGSRYLEFYVFDTNVQAALCLTAFNWGSPRDGEAPDPFHPVTILALNGSKVDGNLILDLWDDESALQTVRPGHPAFARVAAQHKFEAVGLSATAAIYDFGDQHRPYITFLDGLRFGRVHKATPACGTDYGTKLASQVELPSVGEVLRWLDKNTAPSSQPFLTFVEAFEKAGADADELRIQRRTVDLCDRVVRWVPWAARLCPGGRGDAAADAPPAATNGAPLQASFGTAVSAVGDLIGTAFAVMLWALADHGLRPGKVVWWLAGVMLLFWLLFRLRLGIVGFASADGRPEGRLWPVGPLFLFDRLIPLYKIRDEHYAIARYYRAAATDGAAGPDPPDGDACEATLRGRRIRVRPVDVATAERADRLLVALRIVGVVLTIFLLAALNSLTR